MARSQLFVLLLLRSSCAVRAAASAVPKLLQWRPEEAVHDSEGEAAAAAVAAAVAGIGPPPATLDEAALGGSGLDGYVCQVYLPRDEALQDAIGVICNVTADDTCDCDDKFWQGWRPMWRFIEERRREEMAADAKPGEWYLLDASAQCAATFGADRHPVKAACPPGFYCGGGLEPPRTCSSGDLCPGETPEEHRQCPEGFFCPFPAAEKQPCPDGAQCPMGSMSPNACAAGFYCKDGHSNVCPRSHYCPFACVDPIRCSRFMLCPEGSTHENAAIPAAAFLFICVMFLVVGARYYQRFVQSGFRACTVMAVMIGLLYPIDAAIGGFLTLNVVGITANYALLRIGGCPAYSARLLMCTTLFSGLVVLWLINPAWSLLCAGILLCCALGWLMTREDQTSLLTGRALMLGFCGALVFGFAHADPELLLSVVVCDGVYVGYLLVSYLLNECQWFNRPSLPFSSRWNEEEGGTFRMPSQEGFDGHLHQITPPTSAFVTSGTIPGILDGARALVSGRRAPPPSLPAAVSSCGAASLPPAPSVGARSPTMSWSSLPVDPSSPHAPGSSLRVRDVASTNSHCGLGAPSVATASSSSSMSRPGELGGIGSLPIFQRSNGGGGVREVGCRAGVSFVLKELGFKLHDGTALLSGLNFTIAAGRRVAVMGPSGSGKSTLLAVLSGQASYGKVSGDLFIGGQSAASGSPLSGLKRVTGYVPQDDVLHGELTVQENISYQAKLRLPAAKSDEEVAEEVAKVAEELHLTPILASRVGTAEKRGISGGQRKRVSIAMELVVQPLLLFADEPTSGLDSTTAHEVVDCLNGAAERLSTTVLSVIHQPRYETLLLFDMLVLLATGGTLIYAGPAATSMQHFAEYLQVKFPPNANPADVMLDSIQGNSVLSEYSVASLRSAGASALREESGPAACLEVDLDLLRRETPPFFRAVLIFMDRAMLQTMRAHSAVVINQVLCITVTCILCSILANNRIENFLMQSCLATLFLMLLQGVAAQRIFGADLLITVREARGGMPMIAYLVAKDLASLFEITLSAAVFASSYGPFSGVQQPVTSIFAGAWAFIYSVYGLSYISSICLSPGAAQMTAVVAAFVSFCVSGVYQPQLPDMAGYLGGRGWMIPAMSSVRWFWGYLLTKEMHYLTPLSRRYGSNALRSRGYDLAFLDGCSLEGIPESGNGLIMLPEIWTENRGWVCSGVDMLLLGIMFRFLAGICLILYLYAKTSKWAQFFGESERGSWQLFGRVFKLLIGNFMFLFLLAEVTIFSIQRINIRHLLVYLGFPMPS